MAGGNFDGAGRAARWVFVHARILSGRGDRRFAGARYCVRAQAGGTNVGAYSRRRMKEPPLPVLRAVAERTLAHYEAGAASFWEGTRGHDVSQNLDALLAALPSRKGLRILDFGCGPGRDLANLRDLGHAPTGLDGCAAFVEMARAHSGCPVLAQSFFELELLPATFDGIFANASLFHVPRATLPRVLQDLFTALVPGGVLFCSNPRALGG